jgi:hypothetical protein
MNLYGLIIEEEENKSEERAVRKVTFTNRVGEYFFFFFTSLSVVRPKPDSYLGSGGAATS